MNVSIDVLITVEKVGVYRARTRIISVATGDSRCGAEIIHEHTQLYSKRTYESVQRSSYAIARRWITKHGYIEYVPEPDSPEVDPTQPGELKIYYIGEVETA